VELATSIELDGGADEEDNKVADHYLFVLFYLHCTVFMESFRRRLVVGR